MTKETWYRRKTWRAALVLLALALSEAGCSIATLGSARTIDPGTTQVWLAPQLLRVSRGSKPYVGPQFELGGRYGLAPNLDLGARLWLPLPGYALDARVGLRRARGAGLDVALQPGGSYLYIPGGSGNDAPMHLATAHLPLLLGWHFASGHQAVLGIKLIDLVAIDTSTYGQTAQLLTGAVTLGGVLQVTDNFAVAPEVGLGTLLLGSLSGFGADLGFGGATLQASLGFMFGGRQLRQHCVDLPVPATE
ncbi:MAG: hypothetical protein HY902_06220 [Deltaproteobacteria bacterium]|nr:hypothetical protein [Deltaproteobacteria bacterium]